MAVNIPSQRLDFNVMMKAMQEASEAGFRRSQEMQQRITTETLRAAYIAGYQACMTDYEIEDEGALVAEGNSNA